MRTKRSALLLVLFLIIASTVSISTVFAQDELQCGDTVEDEFDGDPVTYTLVVEEGQFVHVSLTSEDFDTYLEVYEDGDLIASNDDGGSNLNSLLAISEAGEYELVVSSFGSSAEGDFELSIQCAEDCQVSEDDLSSRHPEFQFEFDAEEGDTVLLAVNSDEFDTYLNLLDEDEDNITSDDDSGANLNSLIVYEVEDDGTYIAEATSYSGEETGEFTLVVCADAGDVEIPEDTTPQYIPLECGDTVNGTVSDEFPIALYYFNGIEGDEITLTMNATGDELLDPYLALFSPSSIQNNETVDENDDTNGVNSEIVYELDEDGVYIVQASRYNYADGVSEGDFELSLECDGTRGK